MDKDLSFFINLGKECELTGDDLLKFAKSELKAYQDSVRHERAAARAEAAAAREAAEKEAAAAREAAVKEAAAARAHELELERVRRGSGCPGDTTGASKFKFKPKPFSEKLDSLDSWFDLFERQAAFCNIDDQMKKLFLYDCFHGKYNAALLATKEDATYDTIKTAMLKQFNMTSNDYRKKFFGSKPEKDESFAAYLQRLEASLDKWISLQGKKDPETLRNMFLSHVIFESCSESFVTHLLEREISKVADMEKQATAYFQAHSGASIGKTTDAYLGANAALPNRNRSQDSLRKPDRARTEGKKPWTKSRHETELPLGQSHCYRCWQMGHMKRDCPYSDEAAEQSRGLMEKHVFPEPKNQSVHGRAARPVDDTSSGDSDSDGAGDCLQSSLALDPSSSLGLSKHIHAGIITNNNTIEPVQVLRDTGSVVHGINHRLVKRHQFTGKWQKVIGFGGQCHEYPLARVEVITPMLKGTILACVMKDFSPSFDLLIGNGGVLNFVAPQDDRGNGGTMRYLTGKPRIKRTGMERRPLGNKCHACGHNGI